MHLQGLCQALLGPVLQGLLGNVCRTKLRLLATHHLGAAKQGGPPGPNMPGGSPDPAFRCLVVPEVWGSRIPAPVPSSGPRTLEQALGRAGAMFSALTPCPEQMETAGKGQGHDSLINMYCARDQRNRRKRGGTPGTWVGEAETPSWRKSMGRVVSHPCLHYQQTAGLYLFTKLKVDQTPSSFWWLGQLLQKGICRGGPEVPITSYLQKPSVPGSSPPLSAPYPPLVCRQAAQWQWCGSADYFYRLQLTSLGVGVLPSRHHPIRGGSENRSCDRGQVSPIGPQVRGSVPVLDLTLNHSTKPSSRCPVH